jgi:hypothetical protein
MSADPSRRRRVIAALVGVAAFVVYNANGREIEVGDSFPTRLAARELVLRQTPTLDRVVAERPEVAGWPSVVQTADGHYRSAYSFAPTFEAAGLGALLHATGAVDLAAPRAASLVAKLTASLLTALATALAFLTARRRTSEVRAVLIAAGFGLGTGLWPVVSQTLWQHETAIFGLMAAVWMLDRDPDATPPLALIGLVLGLAGAARAQVTPAIAVLALAAIVGSGSWRRAAGLWTLAAFALGTAALGMVWYGHPLGPRLAMLATMPESHMVTGTISHQPWIGMLGLLVSPNRGIFIFSPVVVVALIGLSASRGTGAPGRALRWFGAAALVQFTVYGSFSVWWAGYSYGPRYLLDLLPMLVPFAAIGIDRICLHRWSRVAAAMLLAWSIGISAVGAFYYQAETWNSTPEDVDERHERLWDWRDLEIRACLDAGLNPDNFTLFDRRAFRQPPLR